jgi:hypothetical protein
LASACPQSSLATAMPAYLQPLGIFCLDDVARDQNVPPPLRNRRARKPSVQSCPHPPHQGCGCYDSGPMYSRLQAPNTPAAR